MLPKPLLQEMAAFTSPTEGTVVAAPQIITCDALVPWPCMTLLAICLDMLT